MRILLVAIVLALATPARAAMMVNYDLAGLVMRSTAIVIADRTPGKLSHYKVVRAIRGPLAAGAEFDLDDGLYDTTGIDARVIAFLSPLSTGGWYPTSAGLRVVKQGKVFRYEQWNNPGGFTSVPQGHDPEDNWRASEQIDEPTFERELAAAIARVDALTAATALTDPVKRRAAVLALLPPIGGGHGGGGFYVDELTRAASSQLGKHGDLEGALEARLHDHSAIDNWFDQPGTVAELLAIAKDPGKPLAIRRVAIASVTDHSDYFANAIAVTAMVALTSDPAPAIRAAAVASVARTWGWQSSDAKEEVARKKLQRETRAALAKLYASEPENVVLAALVSAYGDALPARRDGPDVVAYLGARGGELSVDVACTRHVKLTGGKLLASGKGGTVEAAARIVLACNGTSFGGGSTTGKELAAGAYQLSVEVRVAGKPVTIPLGAVVVGATGELALDF